METKEPTDPPNIYLSSLHTAGEFGGKSTVATSWLTFVLVCPNTHLYWSTLANADQ